MSETKSKVIFFLKFEDLKGFIKRRILLIIIFHFIIIAFVMWKEPSLLKLSALCARVN